MIVLEFKAKGKPTQYSAIDEAIRTAQFIRNKAIRFWMDNSGVGQKDLYRLSKTLRDEFPFAKDLNSSACQASIERAYSAISRFYENCRKAVPVQKGYPRFKKNGRSVEYKTSGWKLSEIRKQITFTDQKGIDRLKLKGTWNLNFYQPEQIKRVRLIRRADGYGDSTSTLAGAILLKQVGSVNEESPRHKGWGVSKKPVASRPFLDFYVKM